MEKTRILLIEDDDDILQLIKFNIEAQLANAEVVTHNTGVGAFEKMKASLPSLVILDVMLPGIYGTEILQLARRDDETKNIPVIMLTARADEEDRIAGLEAGADDYVTKPFSPKELVLRIQGLLRRSNPQASSSKGEVLQIANLKLFPKEHKLTMNDEPVTLTLTEFQLLHFLAENAGRLQNRDVLLQKVWGYDGNINTRTVDTHIKRLRQKLGNSGSLIETVHGLGYRLKG